LSAFGHALVGGFRLTLGETDGERGGGQENEGFLAYLADGDSAA